MTVHLGVEVLVLGTGARTERLDPDVLAFMRKKGIAVEVQDTDSIRNLYSSIPRRLACWVSEHGGPTPY
ncbi:hypothetical protein NFI96_004809 [Prochilodus magdalenae]|nr:hypothetical protein NFI96_004809 [Prochilodus magdalenae]